MKLTKVHWIGIIFGTIISLVDLIFFLGDSNLFIFLLGISLIIIVLPFFLAIFMATKKEQDVSEMFLEFSRNLTESVKAGTPISTSIMNMSNKNYGALTPNIKKLANQISIGIPVNKALENFSYDVGSPVITRAITLIREAERAGGEIEYILEAVAKSIAEVEKLKKERQAAIYSLTVQGYIIFFIFVGIMLVMEFKILPLTAGIGSVSSFLNAGAPSSAASLSPEALSSPFLFLLLTQGFFAGLVMGKLAEGTIKSGIKHSFILTVLAFLISVGARVAFLP